MKMEEKEMLLLRAPDNCLSELSPVDIQCLFGSSVWVFADMLTDNYLLFLEIILTIGRASLGV